MRNEKKEQLLCFVLVNELSFSLYATNQILRYKSFKNKNGASTKEAPFLIMILKSIIQ
ncbi:MAG: hypothetical protein KDC15_07780 [Chitinophagaceae bacterium]|nr:hypothetical protein [Chitinophagaceae bacterium]